MSYIKLKCQECIERKEEHPRDAEWMLLDDVLNRLLPLCETHWNEYCHMEGEENLTFESIDDEDGWLRMVNKELKSWNNRYTALLNLRSKTN